MVQVVNTTALHWKGELESLERADGKALRRKASDWLRWTSKLPKSPTLLRHKLREYAEGMIARAEGVITEQAVPSTSSTEPQQTPSLALAADRPREGSAEGEGLQRQPTDTEHALAKQNAWLRRELEKAFRELQSLKQGPQPTPQPAAAAAAAAADGEAGVPPSPAASQGPKEVVFFGLPLAQRASCSDASSAVQRFCTEALQLELPAPEVTNALTLHGRRPQSGGASAPRPATVVVARVAAPQAAAIFEAKSKLDATCPVSIDWQRSPEERKRRQALRLLRRQVGQAGGEGNARVGQGDDGEGESEPHASR